MEFSINAFGLDPAGYLAVAKQAEAVGVHTLWLSDHLVTPASFSDTYPYSASGTPGYGLDTTLNDVWVLIGHLSAVTQRLRLGAGVYILPLRNPFVTALAVGTAQRLSGGRVQFGVGAGWMREEFDTVGEDFDSRGKRLDECLDVIDGLFAGGAFQYQGKFFSFSPAGLGGPPVGKVPVIFGGSTDAAIRRTVRRGDGWFGPTCPLEESVALIRRLQQDRDDLALYPRLVGDITAATFERYAEAGLPHVVVSGGQLFKGLDSQAARDEALEEVAALVRAI